MNNKSNSQRKIERLEHALRCKQIDMNELAKKVSTDEERKECIIAKEKIKQADNLRNIMNDSLNFKNEEITKLKLEKVKLKSENIELKSENIELKEKPKFHDNITDDEYGLIGLKEYTYSFVSDRVSYNGYLSNDIISDYEHIEREHKIDTKHSFTLIKKDDDGKFGCPHNKANFSVIAYSLDNDDEKIAAYYGVDIGHAHNWSYRYGIGKNDTSQIMLFPRLYKLTIFCNGDLTKITEHTSIKSSTVKEYLKGFGLYNEIKHAPTLREIEFSDEFYNKLDELRYNHSNDDLSESFNINKKLIRKALRFLPPKENRNNFNKW